MIDFIKYETRKYRLLKEVLSLHKKRLKTLKHTRAQAHVVRDIMTVKKLVQKYTQKIKTIEACYYFNKQIFNQTAGKLTKSSTILQT